MTIVLVVSVIVVPLVAAWMQRPEATEDKKWRSVVLWSAVVTIAHSIIVFVCVGHRGGSVSSVALVGGAVLATGAYFVLLAHMKPSFERLGGGWREVRLGFKPRKAEPVLRRVLYAWTCVLVLLSLVPLRYAGVFQSDPFGARISAVVALGQFDPIVERRTIAVGQCTRAWEPDESNLVVPCGAEHAAEIIGGEASGDDCPSLDGVDTDGLELEVIALDAVHGVIYCVIRSVSPTRRFSGRSGVGELAHTL